MHVREKSRAGGPKSTLAKAAGAEPSGQMRDEKLRAVAQLQRQLQLHYITQQYATLLILQLHLQLELQLHYITLHYTNCTTLHYATLHKLKLQLQLQLHYFTPHYTRRHYSTQHYSALHYIRLHCTRYTTPQLQLQLRYTNYATLQLQLHYTTTTTTTTTAPHHTTSSSCGWGDHCNQCNHSKKTQLQPLFGPSVDSLCHPCITTTQLSYSVLSLKLPPPPCAVLLVYCHFHWKIWEQVTGCYWYIGQTASIWCLLS